MSTITVDFNDIESIYNALSQYRQLLNEYYMSSNSIVASSNQEVQELQTKLRNLQNQADKDTYISQSMSIQANYTRQLQQYDQYIGQTNAYIIRLETQKNQLTSMQEEKQQHLNTLSRKVTDIKAPATPEIGHKCSGESDITGPKTETVYTGEYCTIETAIQYGIFDVVNYFDKSKVPENVDILKGNVYDYTKNHSVCTLDNNTNMAIQNCVLSTSNPWKTADNTYNYCMLPLNIELPSGFKYDASDKSKIDKKPEIPKLKPKSEYYQEKWYDWFSIPEYHLGNSYSTDRTTGRFMKPCSIGYVPHLQMPGKCVSKNDFDDGYFTGTFSYLPLALIHLLGHTKTSLMEKHLSIMRQSSNEFLKSTSEFSFNANDQSLFNHITTNADTQSNIFADIKIDLQYHINNLIKQPFDDRNIYPPTIPSSKYRNDPIGLDKKDRTSKIKEAYDIASNFLLLSTSTDKATQAKYVEWKRNLAEISGYQITDSKFHKQLLSLKKACQVTFNYDNPYSKYIIDQINNNDDNTHHDKLNVVVSTDDRLMSVSDNISENPDNIHPSSALRRSELLDYEKKQQANLAEEDMELKQMEYDPLKYNDIIHKEAIPSPVEKSFINMKNIVMVGIFLIMLVIFFGVIYILASIFWTPIANILNRVILAIYEAMFKLKDSMFRNKSEPPSVTKNMLELQHTFVKNKLEKDIKNIRDFSKWVTLKT